MTDAYYDKKINEEKENLTKYSTLVYVSLQFLGAKNNRKDRNIYSAWVKVRDAQDTKERYARLSTFLKLLKDDKAYNPGFVSSIKLEEAIEKRFDTYTSIKLRYHQAYEWASELSENLKATIERYVREYIRTLKEIENLEKQKEEDAKEREALARAREQRREERREQSYTSTPSSSYTPRTRTTYQTREEVKAYTVGEQVVYYEYDRTEERQRKAIDYLNSKIKKAQEDEDHLWLTSDEEILLREALGEHRYHLPMKRVKSGFEIQDKLSKFERYSKFSKNPFKRYYAYPSINELYEVAFDVLQHLPEELMDSKVSVNTNESYINKIKRMSNIGNGLEMYEKMYNIYLKYFNKLDQEEKNRISTEFKNSYTFKHAQDKFEIEDFEILPPNELKRYVNLSVKTKMVNNFSYYTGNDYSIPNRIQSSCMYMSVEEILTTYKSIRYKQDQYSHVYPGDEEERQRQVLAEKYANLQKNFAEAILYKMNLGEMTLELRVQKLTEIVEEMMHERLLFSLPKVDIVTQKEEVEETKEEPVTTKNDSVTVRSSDGMYHYVAGSQEERTTDRALAARYNAQHRYFGMSKLKQALARMNGSWKRFEELWYKVAEASEKEKEQIADELDSMFRR